VNLVNEERWGALADTGVGLCAAHWLLASASALAASKKGALPGQSSGVLTSKSADGMSASYDNSSVMLEGAHHYNLTQYGIQFKDLARMMGAGPMYVGIGAGTGVTGAWQGALQPPF
jgi:hypothetical protein